MKKFLKKIGAIALALCMLLSISVLPAVADEPLPTPETVGYSANNVVAVDLTGIPDMVDYDANSASASFQITSAEGWIKFANLVNTNTEFFAGKTVYLANDIDLLGKSDVGVSTAKARYFAGTFDGQGHAITNLVVSGSYEIAGVFGYLRNATVKNLVIGEGCVIATSKDGAFAGGLTGQTFGTVVIENVESNALVSSTGQNPRSGGIVGNMAGEVIIKNCTNKGTVSGVTRNGGIVGLAESNTACTIESCLNAGEINGKTGVWFTEQSGGIVGGSWSGMLVINKCVNTGNINCSATFGGGIMGGQNVRAGTKVSNCVNYGSLSGGPRSAGLIASELDVSAFPPGTPTQYVTKTNCHDLYVPDYGIGYSEYRVVAATVASAPDIKDYDSNSSATTFKVTDAAGLQKIAALVNGGNTLAGVSLYQTAGISLADVTWTSIGSDATHFFAGTYDGQGYVINNLKQNADTSTAAEVVMGLFGYTKGATLKNIVIGANASFTYTKTDKAATVGAVCAVLNAGTIDNVKNSATVTCSGSAASKIAGVVALVEGTSSVTNATNAGDVKGSAVAGGIVGLAAAGATLTVENVSNAAVVVGAATTTGGILGDCKGTATLKTCRNNGYATDDTVSAGIAGSAASGVTKNDCEDLYIPVEPPKFEGVIGYSSAKVEKKNLDDIPEITEYWSNPSLTAFKISSAESLCEFSEVVACLDPLASCTIYLANDIDMSNVTDFRPIGSNTLVPFSGIFDGQGHVIENMSLIYSETGVSDATCAIFGSLSGTVKNLIVGKNCYFSAEIASVDVAAVVACANAGAVIDNVYSLATVTSVSSLRYTAGILANANGVNITVKNCTNTGNITGAGAVAGIVGYGMQVSATVDNCRNTGKIMGTSDSKSDINSSGGIVAYMVGTNSAIKNSINNGVVSSYGNCGAIIGFSTGKINLTVENCANYGSNVIMGESAITNGVFGDIPDDVNLTMIKVKDYAGQDDATIGQVETVTPNFPSVDPGTDETDTTDDGTESTTEPEEVTDPSTDTTTTPETNGNDDPKPNSGCSSAVFGSLAILIVTFGAALVVKKKED